jgi:recombination protein RecA
MGELLDLGVKAGVVDKSGSWFSYGDQRIGQGRENAKQFLAENIDMADEIEHKVRANAGLIAEAIIGEPIPSADAADDGDAADTANDGDLDDNHDADLSGTA